VSELSYELYSYENIAYELCPVCRIYYAHELLSQSTPPLNIRGVEPFGRTVLCMISISCH